jgi:hypothetical protein
MPGNRRAAAALLLVVLAAGCGADPEGTDPGRDSGADTSVSPSASQEQATSPASMTPQEFVTVLADHLCQVQGKVYEDPTAMGEAFASLPEVEGLSEAETQVLADEVRTDADLSRALNEALLTSCADA